VNKEGIIYTATRDGWIKRLHRNGSLENWKMTNSDTLLGITITKAGEGDLIVCDSEKVKIIILLSIRSNTVDRVLLHNPRYTIYIQSN
jgi:hypothetical protein